MKPETNSSTPSLHETAIVPFLQPDEKFHSNYGLKPTSFSPPLEQYVAQLQQSGDFRSVRISEEAVFDDNGNPYQGAVAIFVVPNPEA